MIASGKGGSIVNVSSAITKRMASTFGVTVATKAAMDAMTKVMALELGPNKVHVISSGMPLFSISFHAPTGPNHYLSHDAKI